MEYNTQTLITRDGKVITGVCAFLGKQNKIDICEENRIVLTPGEQKDEGGPQAYTLPLVVVDSKGNTLSNEILTKLIYKDIVGKKMRKLQKSLRKEKISRPDFDAKIAELESIMESGYTTDTNYAKIARAAGEKYKNRNFIMCGCRERVKKGEKLKKALERLLREEHQKKFKQGIVIPEGDFIYSRDGSSTCVLVWKLKDEWLETCEESVEKSRGSYFCSYEIPEICDNSYNETRAHRFVSLEEAELEIREYMASVPDGDWSKYGGLKMLLAYKNHIK